MATIYMLILVIDPSCHLKQADIKLFLCLFPIRKCKTSNCNNCAVESSTVMRLALPRIKLLCLYIERVTNDLND